MRGPCLGARHITGGLESSRRRRRSRLDPGSSGVELNYRL